MTLGLSLVRVKGNGGGMMRKAGPDAERFDDLVIRRHSGTEPFQQ
jgi:hypothetical protein